MAIQIRDLVILITGASSGIGLEAARLLGREKARLALAARRMDRLQQAAREVEASGGQAIAVQADVGHPDQVAALVAKTVERFGRVDVLVNNAGAGLYASIAETSNEQMERLWRINFLGTFYGIRAVLPVMKSQGSGHILTVSSIVGKRATPFNGAYCSTKFAQVGLMESLRLELRGSGIRTTVLYPSATSSEFLTALENPEHREVKHHGPVQTPEQVAQAIVRAIRHPRTEVMTQKVGRAIAIANAVSPSLVDWVVSKTIKRKILK